MLQVHSSFNGGKITALKQSKPLASGSDDSGGGTTQINLLKINKIKMIFSSHPTDDAAFINNNKRPSIYRAIKRAMPNTPTASPDM
jgi:hypothetical protein